MFSSVPLMWLFTVLFVVTGVYSIVRLAALASGASLAADRVVDRAADRVGDRAVDRAAELSHLLMSVAMIAMTWGWSGCPFSPSGVLQVVAFGLVGRYFLIGAVCGYRAPTAGAYHLVMALAMVWMVASMPLLMGAGSSLGTAMEGMLWMSTGGSGPTGPVGPGAHPWVLTVSLAFVVLLGAATVFWASRAAKRTPGGSAHCAPGRGEPGLSAERGSGEAGLSEPGSVAVMTRPSARVESLLSARADAVCHVLMSAGMAGMLAAML